MALLASAWAFMKSPWGLRIVGALAVIAALFALYQVGVSHGVKREHAANAKLLAAAEAKALKVAKASDKISADARDKHAADVAQIAKLSAQLQQKVTTYVSPASDRRCTIPVGYVRLRDAAGAGVDPVPGPSSGSLDADSGLVLSDLARNDVTNATAFNTAVAEIKAWRGWYAAQAELWSKNTVAPKPAP